MAKNTPDLTIRQRIFPEQLKNAHRKYWNTRLTRILESGPEQGDIQALAEAFNQASRSNGFNPFKDKNTYLRAVKGLYQRVGTRRNAERQVDGTFFDLNHAVGIKNLQLLFKLRPRFEKLADSANSSLNLATLLKAAITERELPEYPSDSLKAVLADLLYTNDYAIRYQSFWLNHQAGNIESSHQLSTLLSFQQDNLEGDKAVKLQGRNIIDFFELLDSRSKADADEKNTLDRYKQLLNTDAVFHIVHYLTTHGHTISNTQRVYLMKSLHKHCQTQLDEVLTTLYNQQLSPQHQESNHTTNTLDELHRVLSDISSVNPAQETAEQRTKFAEDFAGWLSKHEALAQTLLGSRDLTRSAPSTQRQIGNYLSKLQPQKANSFVKQSHWLRGGDLLTAASTLLLREKLTATRFRSVSSQLKGLLSKNSARMHNFTNTLNHALTNFSELNALTQQDILQMLQLPNFCRMFVSPETLYGWLIACEHDANLKSMASKLIASHRDIFKVLMRDKRAQDLLPRFPWLEARNVMESALKDRSRGWLQSTRAKSFVGDMFNRFTVNQSDEVTLAMKDLHLNDKRFIRYSSKHYLPEIGQFPEFQNTTSLEILEYLSTYSETNKNANRRLDYRAISLIGSSKLPDSDTDTEYPSEAEGSNVSTPSNIRLAEPTREIIQRQQRQIVDLTTELEQLRKQHATTTANITEMSFPHTSDDLSDDEGLQGKEEASLLQIREQRIVELETQLRGAGELNDQLAAANEDLNKQLEQSKSLAFEHQSAHENAEKQAAELKAKLTQNQEKSIQLEQSVTTLEQQISSEKRKTIDLEAKLSEAAQTKKVANEQAASDIKALREQLAAAETKLEKATTDYRSLTAQSTELSNTHQALEIKHDDVTKKLSDTEAQLKTAEANLTLQSKALETTSTDKETLQKTVNTNKVRLAELTTELEELKEAKTRLENEYRAEKEAREEALKQSTELDSSIEGLKQKVSTLTGELAGTKAELEAVILTRDEAIKTKSAIKTAKEQIEQQLSERQQELETNQGKLEQAKAEAKQNSEALAAATDANEALEENLTKKETELAKVRAELKEITQARDNAVGEASQLTATKERIEQQLTERQQALETKQDELQTALTKAKEASTKSNKLTAEKEQLEQAVEAKQAELAKLQTQVSELQGKLDTTTETKDSAEKRIFELTEAATTKEAEYQQQLATLQEALKNETAAKDEAEATTNTLKTKSAEQKSAIQELRESLATAENKTLASEIKQIEAEQKLEQLSSELEAIKAASSAGSSPKGSGSGDEAGLVTPAAAKPATPQSPASAARSAPPRKPVTLQTTDLAALAAAAPPRKKDNRSSLSSSDSVGGVGSETGDASQDFTTYLSQLRSSDALTQIDLQELVATLQDKLGQTLAVPSTSQARNRAGQFAKAPAASQAQLRQVKKYLDNFKPDGTVSAQDMLSKIEQLMANKAMDLAALASAAPPRAKQPVRTGDPILDAVKNAPPRPQTFMNGHF